MKKLLLIFLPVLLVFGSSVGSFAVPEDRSVQMIRRAETPRDYFATFDFCDILKDMNYEG